MEMFSKRVSALFAYHKSATQLSSFNNSLSKAKDSSNDISLTHDKVAFHLVKANAKPF